MGRICTFQIVIFAYLGYYLVLPRFLRTRLQFAVLGYIYINSGQVITWTCMRGHSIFSIVVGYRISVIIIIIIFIIIIISALHGSFLPVWRHLSLVLSSFVTGMRSFHIFRLVWSLFLFIPYLHLKLKGVFELVQTDFRYSSRHSFSVSTVLILYHGIFSVVCWI